MNKTFFRLLLASVTLTVITVGAIQAQTPPIAAQEILKPRAETTKETTTPSSIKADMETIRNYIKELVESDQLDTTARTWKTKVPKFPTMEFSDDAKFFWNLKTNKGPIKIEFMPKTAPNHVANFLYLTELKFFDGLTFHRVISSFMAQGGCPLGNGTGSPGYRFNGEFAPGVKHDRPGLLSMANAGPGTDGSQFFITFVPTPWLDGKHTIFGKVVEGEDTLKALEACGSRTGRTSEPLIIESATISTD
jgi:cyclophilin family peptidyl-prolyl cis-trans isomerase